MTYQGDSNRCENRRLLIWSLYIERVDYIRELEELVAKGHQAIELGDTNAIYGSGKTSVLAKYYYKIQQEGKFSPLWIPLDDYSIYRTNTKIQVLRFNRGLYSELPGFYPPVN